MAIDVAALNARLRPTADLPRWGCVRISAPGGTFYLCAPGQDPEVIRAWKSDHGPRAVFSWHELGACFETLEKLPPGARQDWLRDAIALKQALPGARVVGGPSEALEVEILP